MTARFPRLLRLSLRAAAVAAVLVPAFAGEASAQRAGICRDPWVTEVVTEVTGRSPQGMGETGECNINLYGASWSSKDDLRAKVRFSLAALKRENIEFPTQEARSIRDVRTNVTYQASSIYIGPRANAPRKSFNLELPNGYVMAYDRARCYGGGYNRGC